MSTATNALGLKRICTNCGGRFYDLEKRPIICPDCETEFTGEIKAKARRGRTTPEIVKEKPIEKAPPKIEDDEDDIQDDEELDVEVVSLDDAEDTSGGKDDGDEEMLSDEDTLDDIPDLGADIDDVDSEDVLLDEDDEDDL